MKMYLCQCEHSLNLGDATMLVIPLVNKYEWCYKSAFTLEFCELQAHKDQQIIQNNHFVILFVICCTIYQYIPCASFLCLLTNSVKIKGGSNKCFGIAFPVFLKVSFTHSVLAKKETWLMFFLQSFLIGIDQIFSL